MRTPDLGELLVILWIVVLVFVPGKLPSLARFLDRALGDASPPARPPQHAACNTSAGGALPDPGPTDPKPPAA